MLKDALESLKATAVEAAGLRIKKLEGNPRVVFLDQNGVTTPVDLPPPLRSHSFTRLDDLLWFACEESRGRIDAREKHVSVWHSTESIQAVLDEADRREKAIMALETTHVWQTLQLLYEREHAWKQDELIRLLRVDFEGCVPGDILQSVRTVNFGRNEMLSLNAQVVSREMDLSVENAVTGAEKIVDGFEVSGHVYANVLQDTQFTIRIIVEIDHQAKGFRLSLPGDALTTIMLSTQTILRQLITQRLADVEDFDEQESESNFDQVGLFGGRVRVYQGTP